MSFLLQVVTTGGVTYKNEPYHRECFVSHDSSLDSSEFDVLSGVHALQHISGRATIHEQGWEALLRQLLRGNVRQTMQRLHQTHHRFDCLQRKCRIEKEAKNLQELAVRNSSRSRIEIGTMIVSFDSNFDKKPTQNEKPNWKIKVRVGLNDKTSKEK